MGDSWQRHLLTLVVDEFVRNLLWLFLTAVISLTNCTTQTAICESADKDRKIDVFSGSIDLDPITFKDIDLLSLFENIALA